MKNSIWTFLALTVMSCGGGGTPPTIIPPPALEPSGIIAPLEVFGAPSGSPGSACASGRYREFDFWLGDWNITVNGNPAGVSSILQLVAGCAMLEFYQGGAGQSLNVYDASADRWHQTYVFSTPGVATLSGGLVGTAMVLEETRSNGQLDRWTWTQLSATQVRQHYEILKDGSTTSGFDGVYTRRASAGAGVGPQGAGCPATDLSFVVGRWDVYEGDPAGTDTYRGSATFTSELNGCAIIERTTGAANFLGISFIVTKNGQLLREYMDSDARYLRATGGLTNGRVVLSGSRTAADGAAATARLTWESTSGTEFRLTYEFSRDGGATWSTARTYRYIKKA